MVSGEEFGAYNLSIDNTSQMVASNSQRGRNSTNAVNSGPSFFAICRFDTCYITMLVGCGQPAFSSFCFSQSGAFLLSVNSSKTGFKPLPPDEVAICKRVAHARTASGISQVDLAAKLGASPNQLANIESGRVPLKWSTGESVCGALNINQLWLATGQEPMHPFFSEVDPGFILDRSLFSAVCNGPMRKELDLRRDLILTSASPVVDKISDKAFEESLVILIRRLARHIPKNARPEILEWLPKAWNQKTLELLKSGRKDPQG